jgi:amino acid adenylation domain-containing protein
MITARGTNSRQDVGMTDTASAPQDEKVRALLRQRLTAARQSLATTGTAIPRRSEPTAPAALSPVQHRMWFHTQLEPDSAAYNTSLVLRLAGLLDRQALLDAVRDLADRHEVLRSVLQPDGDEVHAVALPATAVPVTVVDATGDVEALVRADVGRPFALDVEPPLRATLWCLAGDEHVLALTVHHVATDAWTTGLLLRELSALYAARIGLAPAPPPPALQYADVAAWQATREDSAEDLDWWAAHLAGLPPLIDLPADRPRPAAPTWAGDTLPLDLGADLSSKVKQAATDLGGTPFMVLMAGLQALLARTGGGTDFAVGVPESGRHHPDTEPVVGCFINTLVHRADVSGAPTGRDLLRRVREVALEAQNRARTPFDKLVERLNPDRNLSASPVFQVMLNVLEVSPPPGLPGVDAELVAFPQRTAKYDLTLTLGNDGERFAGGLGYRTELFDRGTAGRLAGWYTALLAGMLAEPDRPLWEIPLEPVTGPLLAGPAVDHALDRPLYRLIEDWADRTPGATAAIGADGSLTYADLERRANRIAHALLAAGAGANQPVGVLLEPGTDLACALLGIMKAGAGYLPMDPVYPPARVAAILEAAGARVVVTTAEFADRAGPDRVALALDDPRTLAAHPDTRPEVAVGMDDLIHVIFTSGSTGLPKGVAVEHRSVAHYLAAMLPRLDADGGSFAMVSTPAADFGLTCVFGALTTGGTVHLVARETATDPAAFAAYLRRHRVDVLKCVPSHLELLAAEGDLADVLPAKLLVLAGEACPWPLVERVRAARPGLRVQSHYGHTESTMISLVCRTESVPEQRRTGVVPLGEPIDNVAFHVVDAHGRPLPAGVPGELVITGPGIARGYLGRPELTAAQFVADPVDGATRCYRSGDRVVVRADGTVQFLGRVDDQVKVRGYRVEPGEVATALRGLPGVAEAVVLPVGEGAARTLAGWLVPVAGATLEIPAVRSALRERLPDYMVPAAFCVLDRLPLNPNGKLDRAALPAPQRAEGERVPPATPTEQRVADAWAAVLKVEDVGAEDDFFALGGDSFAAVRTVKAIDAGLRVIDLFTRPTVRELAAYLDARDGTAEVGLLHRLSGPPRGTAPSASLVCVPYGGGSAAAFGPVAQALPGHVEVLAVELPGHDAARPDELPLGVDALVDLLAAEIAATVRGPVALYGHCVGSALATALARRLEADGRQVLGVIVAGSFPTARLPGRLSGWLDRTLKRDRWVSDRFVRDGLLATGGLFEDMDEAAVDAALRALQHDFRSAQEWFGTELAAERPPLAVPILCVVGERDRATDLYAERYAEWGAFADRVELAVVPKAGHYFLRHQAEQVATLVADRLASWSAGVLPPRLADRAVPVAGRAGRRELRSFYTVAAGQLVSTMGTALSSFALGIWVFQRTGRISDLALIVMFTQIPTFLLAPIGGAVADRIDRRKVMLGADAVAGVTMLAMVLLLWADRLALWNVCLIVGVTSVSEAFRQPAYLAATAQLVPKPYLNQANSVANLGPGLALLVGPLAGGALITLLGLPGVVVIDVLTFSVGVATLLAVRFPNRLFHCQEESFWAALVGGWRFVLRRKAILVQVLFLMVVNYFTAIMWVAVTPLVLALGSSAALGVVTAVGGVGAAVGAVVVLVWGGTKRRTIGMVGFVIGSGIGTVLIGVYPSVALIAVGLFIRLASMTIGNVHGVSILQVKVGQELQGRVAATNIAIATLMQPLGFLSVGPLAEHVFGPLITGDGPLAGTGIGLGQDRGLALLMVCSGIFLAVWGALGLAYRPLRLAEDALPDASPDPEIDGGLDEIQAAADRKLAELAGVR